MEYLRGVILNLIEMWALMQRDGRSHRSVWSIFPDFHQIP
jgi:hypothetical protein